jgi:CubicO group peptidase (beta-lactamase class C family)
MKIRIAALLLALSLLSPSANAAAPPAAGSPDAAMVKAVEAYVRPLAERGDLSGQLLITRRGRPVLERYYGKANAELNVPVTATTRFNIASVTKPMTAVIAIQLIEEGKLAISDSIARWIPDFPKGDSITVDMLLRHRSGIPHEVIPDSEAVRPFSAADVVERAKKLPLDFPPGSQGSYSSGGYEVLARVLELASGRSYSELLEERVLKPLGMTSTGNADSRTLLSGRAAAYTPGPRGLQNAPLEDFSRLVGAGSVWSTTSDLSRFVDGLIAGKLGDGARVSFVRQGHVDLNGRTGGFKAWAMWDSATQVGAYFAGNVSSGAPDALKRDVMKLAAGQTVASPKLPALSGLVPAESELRRWEGDYRLENGGPKLAIRLHDGALWSNDWVMLPAKDGSMFSPRDYGTIRAVAGSDGKVSRLDWEQGGVVYKAPRTANSSR